MHPSLEKRLRGGLLAVGIGVGSLYLSGCATNNPALNAFMNYGVAPVIAAEAGRSQQTVIVNGSAVQDKFVSDPAKNVRFISAKEYSLKPNSPILFEDVRAEFFQDEQFNVVAYVDAGFMAKTRYVARDESGKVVTEATFPNTHTFFGYTYRPKELSPGAYTANFYRHEQYIGKVDFKVKPRLK